MQKIVRAVLQAHSGGNAHCGDQHCAPHHPQHHSCHDNHHGHHEGCHQSGSQPPGGKPPVIIIDRVH